MKKIIKFIGFIFLLFLLISCDANENEETSTITQAQVLEAIDEYKDTLIKLGASNQEEMQSQGILRLNDPIRFTKDQLTESTSTAGIDLEWLDMSMLILNLAEAVTLSERYELGTEVMIYDILEDMSMWGWSADENTFFIMTYESDVLYLRIGNDQALVQTFYFNYDEFGRIEILRLYESKVETIGYQDLYIEDFTEGIGLTMWSESNYNLFTQIESEDGGMYTVIYSNEHEPEIHSGAYDIDGQWINFGYNSYNDIIRMNYDLSSYEFFTHFDESGTLYFEDSIITHELNMRIYPSFYDSSKYSLTAYQDITETNPIVSVDAFNFDTTLTYSSIKEQMSYILSMTDLSFLKLDYTQEASAIYEYYQNMTYYDHLTLLEPFEVTLVNNNEDDDQILEVYPNAFTQLPQPTKLNYQFLGWSTSNESFEVVNQNYQVIEDVTLYAHYEWNVLLSEFNSFFDVDVYDQQIEMTPAMIVGYGIYDMSSNHKGYVFELDVEDMSYGQIRFTIILNDQYEIIATFFPIVPESETFLEDIKLLMDQVSLGTNLETLELVVEEDAFTPLFIPLIEALKSFLFETP